MLLMARELTKEHPVLETERPPMGNSPRLTRRRLLAMTAAAAAFGLRRAQAQTTSDPGCTLGFVHGLLHFAPDCPLLDPPGTTIGDDDFVVAPPSHLVALEAATEGTAGTETEDGFVPQSGSRRKRKKARLHRRSKQRRHTGRRHKKHGGGGGTDTTTTTTMP
jgi:hypothetical protein